MTVNYIICFSEDQRIGLWNTLEKNFRQFSRYTTNIVSIYYRLLWPDKEISELNQT